MNDVEAAVNLILNAKVYKDIFKGDVEHALQQVLPPIKLNQYRDIEKSRRKLFLSKDSEFKALLRLKEKQEEQHFLNENKKEQNELEDIIAARFLFHSNPSNP